MNHVGIEVITAVVMKSSARIFWDITPYSPMKVNQRFGRTRRLHLQGRRISQARNQLESRRRQNSSNEAYYDGWICSSVQEE
jgi:hypothetical protein